MLLKFCKALRLFLVSTLYSNDNYNILNVGAAFVLDGHHHQQNDEIDRLHSVALRLDDLQPGVEQQLRPDQRSRNGIEHVRLNVLHAIRVGMQLKSQAIPQVLDHLQLVIRRKN